MNPDNRTPVIDVENLSFRFDGGPPVLEDVNLEIAAGDFASVIGPNGGSVDGRRRRRERAHGRERRGPVAHRTDRSRERRDLLRVAAPAMRSSR